jgi:hypothetical protein
MEDARQAGKREMYEPSASLAPALSRAQRLRRIQSRRRRALLQSAMSTAGWLAWSAGLLIVTAGSLLTLAAR